ncbi:MAG TPA: GNAT family N-acetyltransferase [Longimicrobiales bacterium]|nr:GNAT family N-acetyltransferase [Longimicrobiales bacterium]
MIRLATPADAPQILDIYAPVVRETPISFEWEVPSADEIASRIEKVLAVRPWLVYEDEGRVLGYVYASVFRDRAAYQWGTEVSVYIDESARGRGLGCTLYTVLFDVLRAQNFITAIAGATVPNEATERLHLRMGFTEFGRYHSAGYKFGKWHDVVFWSLSLREYPAAPQPIIPISELDLKKWLT